MSKSDLLWAIREIDQDLILEADAPVMKTHARPLRLALIAAVVVILLSGTVLGVYVGIHWSELMETYFHVDDGDKDLMDSSVQTVYASAEQDGCTFSITQIMGDEHCMIANLDIQLPDNLATTPINAEELRSVAEANGHEWDSVTWRLDISYGYDGTSEYIPAPIYAETLFFPIGLHKDELIAGAKAYMKEDANTIDVYTDAMSWAMYHTALEAYHADPQSGTGCNFGEGTMSRSYNSGTNTLSYLVYMYTENEVQNRPCTLVVSELMLEDVLATYSQPNEEDGVALSYNNLLSEPVVLNFDATYTPQGSDYEIYQDDTLIGTMELSPFTANVSFPQEPDDPNRLAPNRTDYLDDADIEVTLTDGSVITYHTRSSGFSETQFGFFLTEEIVDLSMIEKISLHDYIFKMVK